MANPMQAQDTFTVQLKDGSSLRISKGEVFAASHEVVKLDDGRGLLFKPLDFGEEDVPPPAKSAPAKAEPPKAEVKAARPTPGKVSG
jgi:hypothetical protein